MKQKRKRYTFTLTPEIHEKLNVLSHKERKSMSRFIEHMITNFVSYEKMSEKPLTKV